MSDFAERDLRAWRKAKGLKAQQVAEILGYTSEHISRCEHGTRQLSRNAWRTLIAVTALEEIQP